MDTNIANAPNLDGGLAHGVAEAARRLGISRSQLYLEIRAGRLPAVKAGKRTLITLDAQHAWLAALPPVQRRENAA